MNAFRRSMTMVSILLVTLSMPTAAFAACFDLANEEPSLLEGLLSFHIFAGPPEYDDIQKGDAPEPGYILSLDRPICLKGDEDFSDPLISFNEVHLVPTEATEALMKRLRGRRVMVTLENPMPAMTGHHRRPLVAWVSAIEEVFPVRDPTAAYGTAQTTVEAFYLALRNGDGSLAAGFVIPEKTKAGPFSPKALSDFYGSLTEPLRLVDIVRSGDNSFNVRYTFSTRTSRCNGRATVTTTKRNGRDFIQSIRAENGC